MFRFSNISNDDFVFQAENTTTLFLSIESRDNFTTTAVDFGEGSYTLSATEISDDVGNYTSSAAALSSDATEINGTLEYLDDIDVLTSVQWLCAEITLC